MEVFINKLFYQLRTEVTIGDANEKNTKYICNAFVAKYFAPLKVLFYIHIYIYIYIYIYLSNPLLTLLSILL